MFDLRSALDARPQLGLCITYPAPGIIERIGADWDWLWIDTQHGDLEPGDVLPQVRVADLMGLPCVVRVAGHDPGPIARALDTGASGVLLPVVDTADQARHLVRAAKFPPLGSRSYGGLRPVTLWGRQYASAGSPQPMLICQIETPEGLRNADEIAAVDGVDALFLGPDDMTLRMGLPMDSTRPAGVFDDAYRQMAEAARRHGKHAGGIFLTPNSLKTGLDLGYRLMVCAADALLLSDKSSADTRLLRNVRPDLQRPAGRGDPRDD